MSTNMIKPLKRVKNKKLYEVCGTVDILAQCSNKVTNSCHGEAYDDQTISRLWSVEPVPGPTVSMSRESDVSQRCGVRIHWPQCTGK
eukprot:112360-Rhodomonas_salina.3